MHREMGNGTVPSRTTPHTVQLCYLRAEMCSLFDLPEHKT